MYCLFQDPLLARLYRLTRNQTWWGNPEKQVRTKEESRNDELYLFSWVDISLHFKDHNSIFFLEINSYWFLFTCFALAKVNNFKLKDKLPILKPKVPPATAKPTKQERKQTTTFAPTTAGMKISNFQFLQEQAKLLFCSC